MSSLRTCRIGVCLAVWTSSLAAQLISYPGGATTGCTTSPGYTIPNICVIPNETPLASFPVPAVGRTYTDPNFGTQIEMLSGSGSNHGYSTPSAFSASGKYAALVEQGAQVNVINVATGSVAYANQAGTVSGDTIRWDAYSDDAYYYFNGTKVMKHVLSTNATTTMIDYATDGHGFTQILGGGTGDTTKDNWIGFRAPNEHNVCALNLNTVQTYCADWTTVPNAASFPLTFLDFVLVSPVDSVSNQRYVVLAANPVNLFFTVNLSAGNLQYYTRGPEPAADMPSPGNGNGVCDPGENCLGTTHMDLMTDTDGQVYLTFIGQLESPCQQEVDTYRLSAGGFMMTLASKGGGRTGGMAVSLCGGGPYEKWSDWHVGCARNSAYCVYSSDDPNTVDPTNLTPILPNTSYRQDMFVMRGNALEFRRIAKSRSITFSNDGYWSTTRASISADGGMVLFDSNFGYPNRGEYVAVAYTGFTSAKAGTGASPSISAISLNPSSVTGAQTTTQNLVSLSSAALSTGMSCTLSSSAPQAASVPSSVSISAGATSATFSITTGSVASSTSVTITGSCGGQTATALLTVAPATVSNTQTSTFAPVLINAGGSALTDSSGQKWSADTAYSGGLTWSVSNNISNTSTPSLYQTCRYGNFSYTLPAPNGTYTLTLKFAEVSVTGPRQRLFNVNLNGTQVLTAFDIYSQAGGMFIAVDKSFPVTGTNGSIVVQFTSAGANSPMVNAIQLTQTGSSSTASAILIDSGGSSYTDPSGKVWAADSYYSGGAPWSVSNNISNTTSAALYQTCRYGNFSYNLTVPNGTYNVTLKFAEVSRYGPGQRMFNVSLNGSQVLSNFDIYAQAGGIFIALDKTFSATVTNGTLKIQFSAGSADMPMVNAIQVAPAN